MRNPITFQSRFQSRFGPDHVSRRTTIQSKLMMFCSQQRHVWMGSHSMQTDEPLLTATRCVDGWQDIQSKLMNFSSLQRDVWTNGQANAVKSAESSFSQVKKNTSWSLQRIVDIFQGGTCRGYTKPTAAATAGQTRRPHPTARGALESCCPPRHAFAKGGLRTL